MPQAVYILFGAAFTSLVSLALGRILFHRLRPPLYKQEETPLAFLCGSACLSLLIFLLAAGQLLYKGVLLSLGLAILLLAWRLRAFRSDAPILPALPNIKWVYAPVAGLFLVLCFFHAMAPEMSPDGSSYHLGLVSRYYRERGFARLTTSMYYHLTQAIEMLFLFAYAFGKHSAAALVHFTFLLTLPVLILNYARRKAFPAAGLAAALFVFLSPVVGVDGSSAYNDVAVATIVFGVFSLVQIWDETRANALLIPIGLLTGFAFASKYTAFPALLYAAGYIAWRTRRSVLRPLLTVSLSAFALIAPWLVKNAMITGNPVAPFFNRLFPNPYVHVSFEEEYSASMRHYPGLGSKWEIPLEVTVRGQVLGGLIGPLFLLAPVALIALRWPEGRKLLFSALCFGAAYAANVGTRFLIPPLPYLALAMALVFSRVPGLMAVLVLFHALTSWPSMIPKYSAPYVWRLDRILFRQALRIVPEADFLHSRWPSYAVARMIEQATPPGATVLTFNQTGEAYTTRDIWTVYQSALGNKLGAILWTPLVPDYQPARHVEFAFPARPLLAIKLRQTKSGIPDHWTINEFRLFSSNHELPRSPQWRLRAHPNSWDVPDAFDNSPITRWASWERANPKMFVEVRFPAPVILDSVVVETSTDVAATRMALDGLDPSGQWRTLVAEPRETGIPPPLGLRREATHLLKERGVRYLLVHENDLGAADFAAKQDLWSIHLVGESFGYSLYRIE
jgi:hypothetical protein